MPPTELETGAPGAATLPGAAAAPAAASCAHCADVLEPGGVVHKRIGARELDFCCHGCAFIAEQLSLAGVASRDVAALRPVAPAPDRIEGSAQVELAIDGMACTACALLLEHRLRREPGVVAVQVEYGAGRAWLAIDAERTNAGRLRGAIERCGYRAPTSEAPARARRGARIELARVLVAWFAMMQVMMLALPAYVTSAGDIPGDLEQLLRIAQLVLTVPVLAFSAVPLLRAAWSQWRARFVGMDLPIALGLGAATLASVHATLTAHGPVYFDSITMFVAFVLGSRWLQARALARTRQRVADAEAAARLRAQRLRGWPASLATEAVPADALTPGDLALVAAGEAIPADGRIVQGTSTVSLAWLTGESTPIVANQGDRVVAGSINLEQALVVEVARAGEATSLAALRRLAGDAARARPAIVETGNRVALLFLWTVLAITLATFGGWWYFDPALAVPSALAVLVATCPCALSLAAPAAFSAAQARLARDGVLAARPAAIERLAGVDVFASDKTGTLTTAQPALERAIVVRAACNESQVLSIAAALESLSTHPFARALAEAARARGLSAPAPERGRVTAGGGVEASVHDRRYRLGARDYAFGRIGVDRRSAAAADLATSLLAAGYGLDGGAGDDAELPDASLALLTDDDGVVAVFSFSEQVRDDAVPFAAALRAMDIDLHVVSGDRPAPVRRLAAMLGLDPETHAHAGRSPEDKRRLIAGLQRDGHRVAMLGDGMNDAPVIAQADVSFALASELGGTALAQSRADFVVASNRLGAIAVATVTARRSLSIVRQNFRWAFVYNAAAIPLAALGYLTPVLAAAGMAASSLLVVGNALRLLRADARAPHPVSSVRS